MSERYARQSVLPGIGAPGQARLRAASVLVVGAGGLGSPVLSYLAGAGVGRIVVADHDRVDVTNLHRQVLYRMEDVGRPKAEAARDAVLALNPEVRVDALAHRVGPAIASDLVASVDVVVDAADALALTYLLSDAARAAGRPLVSASVVGTSGYVGAFCGGGPSYRAVFPTLPQGLASCVTAGVLGTAVGVLGALQAHLTLQLLLGLDPSPLGRVVSLDLRTLAVGGFSFAGAPEPEDGAPAFVELGDIRDDDLVVDLRGRDEAGLPVRPDARRVAVEDVARLAAGPPPQARVVLCCRSGLRALLAAQVLREHGLHDVALVALGP